VHAVHLLCYRVKLSNLKLKTQHKQLLGSLLLDIALPAKMFQIAWQTISLKIFLPFSKLPMQQMATMYCMIAFAKAT